MPKELIKPQEINASSRKKISLLFGGVADARNLYETIHLIGGHAHDGKIAEDKSFHFTIVDIKAAAMARNLVIMLIMHEISRSGDLLAVFRSTLPHVLYYTYLAPIMPRFCYDQLQVWIQRAIDCLEGRQGLPNFVYVPSAFRSDVIRIIKEWQGEAWNIFPTKRIRKAVVRCEVTDNLGPWSYQKQESFYVKTGILMMKPQADRLIDTEVPGLNQAYSNFTASTFTGLHGRLLDSLDATWATNVTMIDLEYERNSQKDQGVDIDFSNNPFEFGSQLEEVRVVGNMDCKGLFDHVSVWFVSAAKSLGSLQHRMKVECCVGDVTAIAEQIHYGVVAHRAVEHPLLEAEAVSSNAGPEAGEGSSRKKNKPSASKSGKQKRSYPELEDFPKLYDRIHMSNIPDYTGGTLSMFLCLLPLTWPDSNSFVTANCMRNPNRWQKAAHFNNEYICLYLPSDLEKVFQVKMTYDDPWVDLPMRPPMDFEMMRYHEWRHEPTMSAPSSLSHLISRQKFETWLYRLFLKLVMPPERKADDVGHIFAPLNLTIYLRLGIHLHQVGYPAHWISGVLDSVLSGSITTKARPPRTEPLQIKEVNAEMSQRKQSTAPFVAELSTLISMWQCVLPFGILTPLPLVSEIRKYSLTLKKPPDGSNNSAPTVDSSSSTLPVYCIGRTSVPTFSTTRWPMAQSRSPSARRASMLSQPGCGIVRTVPSASGCGGMLSTI